MFSAAALYCCLVSDRNVPVFTHCLLSGSTNFIKLFMGVFTNVARVGTAHEAQGVLWSFSVPRVLINECV